MKWIIKSAVNGEPIARERVELSRKEIVQSIVDAGRQYLSYSAQLGGKDNAGNRIEEHVIIIEDVGDARII